jgi:hypothetical protein
METVDLRMEAKQILDGLNEERLTVAFDLLTALKNLSPPQIAMEDFASCFESRSDWGVESEIDWLDTEYMEQAKRDADDSITLESVRAALAKIPGSLSDTIISEREDRF